MDRFWLPQYPPGVVADIDPDQLSSLKALIENSCDRFADRVAYISMGTSISFRDLEQRSRAFGAWLQHRAGLKAQDRVAIMLPNLLQYPIAMFGALRAGFVVVNTNPLYTVSELRHQLIDSGATAVVVLENFAATLAQALPGTNVRTVIVTSVGEQLKFPKGLIVDAVIRHVQKKVPKWHIQGARRFGEVLAEGRILELKSVNLTHDDIAYLQYTGGTTGVAKGAMLTHGNMVANVLQSRAWFVQVELEDIS